MGGSSSPSKAEMSAGEKASLASGMAEWDHYKSNYAPLEKEYLEASDKDYTDRARAQAASAVMRGGTDGMRQAGAMGGITDASAAVAEGLTTGKTSATNSAQTLRDQRLVGALGVGRELATDTTTSMATLARSGASGSITKMQADLQRSTAKSAAIGQVAGAAIGAGVAHGVENGWFDGAKPAEGGLYGQVDAYSTAPMNASLGNLDPRYRGMA